MILLGVNRSHDSSVTLSVDGEVIFFIETERLNNIRHGSYAFPAIAEIRKYVPYIDGLVLSGTTPVIRRFDNLFDMDAYTAAVRSLGGEFYTRNFFTVDLGERHHLTHAVSAYYGSGFDTALCIVKDGNGSRYDTEWGSAGEIETSFVIDRKDVFLVERKLELLTIDECKYPDEITTIAPTMSEGDAFSHLSKGMGFGVWDAGKVMGLSSYGGPSSYAFMRDGIIKVDDVLSIEGERRFDHMADISYAIQTELEENTINHVLKMIEKTGVTDVAVSGGIFQNCVMNFKILKAMPAGSRLYVEPLSTDAGTSMGAVDWICRKDGEHYSNKRESLYLGSHPVYKDIPDSVPVAPHEVAELIAERKIVAIFQGRSEGGTRALGNRSILYDPRDPDGKDRVNVVKKREWFRPFAGSVLHEEAPFWFDMDKLEESPYMLFAVDVKEDRKEEIPCIVHVNNTCRIQTVKAEQNKHFYKLIEEFYWITGVPMVLNTSFNLAGDAIVETLDDALDTLYNSEIDALYLPEIGRIVYNNKA